MKIIDLVVRSLLILGGLNWGLIGLFNINLVSVLFGDMTAFSRIFYIIVGVAAFYSIYRAYIQHVR